MAGHGAEPDSTVALRTPGLEDGGTDSQAARAGHTSPDLWFGRITTAAKVGGSPPHPRAFGPTALSIAATASKILSIFSI
jgi:hypothetical protein